MNLFESNHLFFFLLLAHIIVMEIIAWFTISYFGNGWIPTLMTAFILATSQVRCDPSPAMQSPPIPPPRPLARRGLGADAGQTSLALSPQAQAGWLQHDYGHLSVYKKSTWNHIVHKFIIGHLKVNVSRPGHPSHQLAVGHCPLASLRPVRTMSAGLGHRTCQFSTSLNFQALPPDLVRYTKPVYSL